MPAGKMARCFILLVVLAAPVGGCAIHRAAVANDAQNKMVGLTKEQVLACMGPPVAKAAEGATEVWSYNSGNNKQIVSTVVNSNANVSVSGNPNYATGQATTTGTGLGVASSRYCTVNVTMVDGRVSRINYVGPTYGR